jgi:hypothetical protein
MKDAGRRHPTGGQLNQRVINTAWLAIPAITIAAWLIIWATHVPPHGSAGRWVALALAAAFGAENVVVLFFLSLSFAMDGSNEARLPVARPLRYVFRTGTKVIVILGVANAVFTLCVAMVGSIF